MPAQPSAEQLAADPWRHRFTLVFDQEGYSPAFFLRMKQKHIACLTYHKYPGAEWPEEEFVPCQVESSAGERMEMKLAERGTLLGEKVWVREIRKLTKSGHQTACLCTDYRSALAPLACAMFARWSEAKLLQIYARTLQSRWISGLLHRGRS
ncbi:MAG: putative transposase [Gammaproteobacteria bacterium]